MSWFKDLKDIWFDGDKASDELITQRIEVCNSCDKLLESLVCSECKCWAPIKVRFKSTNCPLEKW